MIILFLDFDGVLLLWSPVDGDEFSCLPRLIKLLREQQFATLQIVIASSWGTSRIIFDSEVRIKMRLPDEMHDYFPTYFKQRIIGMTPYQKGLAEIGGRQRETESWLSANGREQTPWIALDDIDDFFDVDCANLLVGRGVHGFDNEYEL